MRPNSLQVRAARSLLEWSQPDLATAAGVHLRTVAACESSTSRVSADSMLAIVGALEQAGIVFLDDDEGFGVRRKVPSAAGQRRRQRRG